MRVDTRRTSAAVVAVVAMLLAAGCAADDVAVQPGVNLSATESPDRGSTTAPPPETGSATLAPTGPTEPADPTVSPTGVHDPDVPSLLDIWPDAVEHADDATAIDFVIADELLDTDLEIRGQIDDSNFQISGTAGGSDVNLIWVDGEGYLFADADYWEQSGIPDGSTVADSWVTMPPEMNMTNALSVSSMWESMRSGIFAIDPDVSPEAFATRQAVLDDLDGVPAYHYALAEEDIEIWVDIEDHSVMRFDLSAPGGEVSSVLIRAWNEDVEVLTAPDDATTFEEAYGLLTPEDEEP